MLDETWEFNGSTWRQIVTEDAPPVGQGPAMAYHAGIKRTVLCTGGTYQNWHNQTWIYDGFNWERIATTDQPAPRYESQIVYDSDNEQLASAFLL